jgi:nucleotide-binding universal stress UspA family protein
MSQQSQTIATIIVPLDGSELAEAAVPVAAAIAQAGGAHINLVTVALTYEVSVQAQIDALTRHGIDKVRAELQTRFPEVTQVVLAGDPAKEIAGHAISIGADLIVMATHGRTGLKKLLLGSVADNLLSESHVPVLLVKDGSGEHAPSVVAPASFKRIVFPLDGTEPGSAATPIAMELARLLNAWTVLVNVIEDGGVNRAETQSYEIAGNFEKAELAVELQVLSGDPGRAIAEFASEEPESLVVMSSLGATGVARGTHRGSVADYVVKHANAPVLIVPPRGFLGSVVE